VFLVFVSLQGAPEYNPKPMKRILSIVLPLIVAISASGADRLARDPEQTSIATTGRIVRLDLKNRTLKVRGSDNQPLRNISQMMQSLKQRIGITLPGGIAIGLPGRNPKSTTKPAGDAVNNLDEYTVVITPDTVIQDGGETIRLQDFKVGETISIHGVLLGDTLTASRIAKWS
jgi:hypothetical protein